MCCVCACVCLYVNVYLLSIVQAFLVNLIFFSSDRRRSWLVLGVHLNRFNSVIRVHVCIYSLYIRCVQAMIDEVIAINSHILLQVQHPVLNSCRSSCLSDEHNVSIHPPTFPLSFFLCALVYQSSIVYYIIAFEQHIITFSWQTKTFYNTINSIDNTSPK